MIERRFDNRDEWLRWRETKATGTKMKDLAVKPRTNGIKIGDEIVNAAQIELAAEFLTKYDYREGENWRNAAERGLFLEPEAFARAVKELGIKAERMDNVGIERDDGITAVSPDSLSEDHKVAIETKCLGIGKHLTAVLAGKGNDSAKEMLKKEFGSQVAQYFTVIDELETLILAFYDPRFIDENNQFAYIEFKREELADEILRNGDIIEDSKDKIKLVMKEIK